ncbi:MAG: hypothetical protein AAFR88_05175, partial [Pseudomonadota bacterium]
MSFKLAAAKLSATAAGVALMTGGAVQVAQQGGAVRVAEPMVTDEPIYSSDADGKLVKGAPPLPTPVVAEPKYIKTRTRELPPLPQPEQRRRRIVERTIECQPIPQGFGGAGAVAQSAPLPAGVVNAYIDPNECPPIAQVAYAPAPLPPLPPVRGGGGGGAPVIVGGGLGGFGGGFGGGFFGGGFFGGGGSSSGDVSVVSTTTTGGTDGGSTSTSTSGGSTSTSGDVSTSSGSTTGTPSSTTTTTTTTSGNIDNSTTTTSGGTT